MRKRTVIVDGYNVIHRVKALDRYVDKGMETARNRLISHCAECRAAKRDIAEFLIVFDGNSEVIGTRLPPCAGVRVTYTNSGESADDRIVALVRRKPRDERYVVVSDDNEVAGRSRCLGAETMSAHDMYALTANAAGRHRTRRRKEGKAALSPRQEKEINDSLKEAWGIED